MNLEEYNELCRKWHAEPTGQRLGQWLMNHIPDIEDEKIFYSNDKKEAATLFFNRYVITSKNGTAAALSRVDFISHQSY